MALKRQAPLEPVVSSSEEEETSSGEDEGESKEETSSEEKVEKSEYQRKRHATPPPSASATAVSATVKDENKKLFQRVWSDKDEIVILKGICRYTEKKGIEPPADMNDFHDFIKKYVHVEVSRLQLQDKVRRLKKKYQNNLRRGKKGEDPTFTKPHEQKAFVLAKLVWGNKVETPFPEQQMASETPRKSQRTSRMKSSKEELLGMPENLEKNYEMRVDEDLAPSECFKELLDFNKNLGTFGLPENVLQQGMKLMEHPKKKELQKQRKKVHLAELEAFVQRTELVRDQAMQILEAYKSSDK